MEDVAKRDKIEWATRTIFIDEEEWEEYADRVANGHYSIEDRKIKSLRIPLVDVEFAWRRKRLIAHPHDENIIDKPMYSESKNYLEVK
jgi:hypothetical protein